MAYQAFKQFAAALALACAASTASATVYDLGTLNSTLGQSNIQISGAFDDSFTFKTGSMPGVFGTIVGLDGDGDLLAHYRFGVGEAKPSWGLWSTPDPVLVPSDSEAVFTLSQTATGLNPNTNYWFQWAGSATEAAYAITLSPVSANVSPVPEPETFILMLTGLAMIGATARRRKVRTTCPGIQK